MLSSVPLEVQKKTFSVLILGYVWPEPTSSAAGLRTLGLVRAFLKNGWRVHFASHAKENQHKKDLESLGVFTQSVQVNDSRFDAWIAELSPDFVIFDRFVMEEQFGWRVTENSPQSVKVLDTQDLHFLRRQRSRAKVVGEEQQIQNKTAGDIFRELGSIYRCDLTLVLSSYEYQLLTGQYSIPQSLLKILRFSYSEPPHAPAFEALKLEERKDFVFIGNFRHAPNVDAVRWLYQEIWPEIHARLPGAQVHVYGAYPPKEMMDLQNSEMGFSVKGWTPDQYETLARYRVNLAPLRFGAGIKGKITDGWWCGTPVVTTSIGAEGMVDGESDVIKFGGLIAENAHEFANSACELYGVKTLWLTAQKNGYEILDRFYHEAKNTETLLSALCACKAELKELRAKNVIGSMLQHHLHQSTKYMSKWIELKNSAKLSSCIPKPMEFLTEESNQNPTKITT